MRYSKSIALCVGIGGTPAFVINGYFINGAQPYGNFKKMIKLAMRDLKTGKGPNTKKAGDTKPAAAAKPSKPAPKRAPKRAPKPAPKPAAKPAPKPASADDAY